MMCAADLVVRANVQQHREALLRLNATTGGVERQFSHRNAHTVASQVAQAEDPLPVRHHDGLNQQHISIGRSTCMCVCVYACVQTSTDKHLDVFFRPGVEHGCDVTSVMDGDEESSGNNSTAPSAGVSSNFG